jgi:hypothetical protein
MAATRTPIDTSGIVFESGVAIPPQVKASKYPWAQLLGEAGKTFFIPVGTEEEAETARNSIQSSGRNYYSKRELPFRAICRAMPSTDGTWGVRAWAVAQKEEAGE